MCTHIYFAGVLRKIEKQENNETYKRLENQFRATEISLVLK